MNCSDFLFIYLWVFMQNHFSSIQYNFQGKICWMRLHTDTHAQSLCICTHQYQHIVYYANYISSVCDIHIQSIIVQQSVRIVGTAIHLIRDSDQMIRLNVKSIVKLMV